MFNQCFCSAIPQPDNSCQVTNVQEGICLSSDACVVDLSVIVGNLQSGCR